MAHHRIIAAHGNSSRAAGVTESRPRAAIATLASGLIAFAAGWALAAFFLPHQYSDFGVSGRPADTRSTRASTTAPT